MAHQDPITTGDNWFCGEDKDIVCTVYDRDPDAAGAVVQPITGWSFSFMLKRRLSDSDAEAVITKTTDGATPGIEITNGAGGELTVSIAAEDTRDLPPGTYHYEIKRTGAGVGGVVAYDRATLKPSVHASV